MKDEDLIARCQEQIQIHVDKLRSKPNPGFLDEHYCDFCVSEYLTARIPSDRASLQQEVWEYYQDVRRAYNDGTI